MMIFKSQLQSLVETSQPDNEIAICSPWHQFWEGGGPRRRSARSFYPAPSKIWNMLSALDTKFCWRKNTKLFKSIFFWHSITPNHKQPHLTDNFCRNVWTLTTFWWLFTARKWKSFWLLWINWILLILRNQMNSVGNMIHVTELSW